MFSRIACILVIGTVLAPTAHAADVTLRYGQNAAGVTGLSSLPFNVAQRKGYFPREGLNVVMVPIQGGTDRIVAALDKGEIDVGKNATPYMIQAVLKGSDAVAVMSQTTNPIYSLIVRPEIKSFSDLKGKTLGLSTPGDTITLSAVRLLGAKGLKPADYKAKVVVGTPARFDCLKSGECAAVPMGQPEDLAAIKLGFPRLAFTYEAGSDLIFNVDMARRAWGDAEQGHAGAFRARHGVGLRVHERSQEPRRDHDLDQGGRQDFRRGRAADFRSLSRSRQERVAQTRRIESRRFQSRAGADERSRRHPLAAAARGKIRRSAISAGGRDSMSAPRAALSVRI